MLSSYNIDSAYTMLRCALSKKAQSICSFLIGRSGRDVVVTGHAHGFADWCRWLKRSQGVTQSQDEFGNQETLLNLFPFSCCVLLLQPFLRQRLWSVYKNLCKDSRVKRFKLSWFRGATDCTLQAGLLSLDASNERLNNINVSDGFNTSGSNSKPFRKVLS